MCPILALVETSFAEVVLKGAGDGGKVGLPFRAIGAEDLDGYDDAGGVDGGWLRSLNNSCSTRSRTCRSLAFWSELISGSVTVTSLAAEIANRARASPCRSAIER